MISYTLWQLGYRNGFGISFYNIFISFSETTLKLRRYILNVDFIPLFASATLMPVKYKSSWWQGRDPFNLVWLIDRRTHRLLLKL